MNYLALGARLKTFRERVNLSLEALSETTLIPKLQLEKFENDEEQPLIGQLIKLAKALQVNVADIFRERPSKKAFEIIRKEKRTHVRPHLEAHPKARIFDYSYDLLATPSDDKHMNSYLIEFPPHGTRKPKDNITHEGEEFLFVLEGELDAEIAGEKITLKMGDSLYLRSNQPHVFFNTKAEPARVIAVLYPF